MKGIKFCGACFLTTIAVFLTFCPLQAVARQKITLQVLSTKMGTAGYAMGYALSQIINKNHPWIRVENVETSGMAENVKVLALDPRKRKNTIAYASKYMVHMAKVGDGPFKKPYENLKAVARVGLFLNPFATLNPRIKTKDDLIGKRVSLPVKGTTVWVVPKFILEYGWGIWDKVKIEPGMFWAQGKNALLDGMIDVSLQCVTFVGGKWIGLPPTAELMATKPTYWISLGDPEAIKVAREKSGYPIGAVRIPARALGPTQPEPLWSADFPNNWYVDASMDGEVVYELVKTIHEHAEDFGKFHALGKAITKANLAEIAISQSDFHKGALRYYREMELRIGLQ